MSTTKYEDYLRDLVTICAPGVMSGASAIKCGYAARGI